MPWSRTTTLKFMGEGAMEEAVIRHAPESGVYVLPNAFQHLPGTPPEARREATQAALERMQTGTFMFAAVRLDGAGGFGLSSLLAFLANVVSAGLVTGLLLLTPELTFVGRLIVVESVALVAVLVGPVPNWIWWGFSTRYALSGIVNTLIGWVLAGCVIAFSVV
jgi:hypothetical protein